MARLFLISLTLVAALVTACGKNDAPELPGNPQSPLSSAVPVVLTGGSDTG